MSYTFADKFATVKNFRAFMLNGFDLNNRECYYIIACPPHKIEFIQNNDIKNLEETTKILSCGFGAGPSESELQMIKEKYNVEFLN